MFFFLIYCCYAFNSMYVIKLLDTSLQNKRRLKLFKCLLNQNQVTKSNQNTKAFIIQTPAHFQCDILIC